MSRYRGGFGFTTDELAGIVDGHREQSLERARGTGDIECSCGVIIEDEFDADRRRWLAIHIEAAERRGDDVVHAEVVF